MVSLKSEMRDRIVSRAIFHPVSAPQQPQPPPQITLSRELCALSIKCYIKFNASYVRKCVNVSAKMMMTTTIIFIKMKNKNNKNMKLTIKSRSGEGAAVCVACWLVTGTGKTMKITVTTVTDNMKTLLH